MHPAIRRAQAIPILSLLLISYSFAQDRSPSQPYIVTPNSHVVFIEYEAWFGPNAVTFQGTAAKPFLQSADMQPVGGGYDSRDPDVIRQHVEWFQSAGLDGAIIEVTNNVSCIFNSIWFARKYLPYCTQAFRENNQAIRDNTGNIYPAWAQLGTSLKLIPLLGGQDNDVLYPDLDGKTAFEKEIDYFGARMREHPELTVIYQGKPLMLIFLGAAQDPNPADNPLWVRINHFIEAHREIRDKYTFRLMAGYLDSQPPFWVNSFPSTGPNEIKPMYDMWSWVDRLNGTCTEPLCPYFPSYNVTAINSSCESDKKSNENGMPHVSPPLRDVGSDAPALTRNSSQPAPIPTTSACHSDPTRSVSEEPAFLSPREDRPSNSTRRVENLTVSIATAGQYGWSCPNPNAPPYCPDSSLRWPTNDGTYGTFDNFMTYAAQLQPVFLIVHQFNEYVQPDEGFDAQTIDDSDVTDLWGHTALDAIAQQIQLYRESLH